MSMGPLHGIRVLDLTRLLPGGVLTQLLADLGADVVKVERPGSGDETRWMGSGDGDSSGMHRFMDRGKRSVALDLKDPDGRAAAVRLAASSDLVVEGFRPGVAERLGLGYEELSAEKPALVYCSVNGYGRGGPREQAAGHDLNYSAWAGVTGFSDAGPSGVPRAFGAQLADITGGLLGAVGLLAALVRARETGQGDHVEVALADAALWALGIHVSGFLAGEAPQEPASVPVNGSTPAYRVYRCADGRDLAVGALERHFWVELVEGLGRPDLADAPDDPRSGAELEALFATRPAADWLDRLADRDTCIAPVARFDELPGDSQFAARDMLVADPGHPEALQVGRPVKLASASPPWRAAPVTVGRDTATVLRERGFSENEVDALVAPQLAEAGSR